MKTHVRTASKLGSRAVLLFWALMVFSPSLGFAGLQWHNFGTNGNKTTIALGRVAITIEPKDATYPGGDDLVLTLRIPSQEARRYYFSSDYGYGAVAIHGDVLLLKYGVGGGTFAREDHIKVLRLNYDLQELVDVQSSCYVLTDPHNAAPDLFEYQLNIQEAGGWTTLTLRLPKPQKGIPSEKIVRWKNDA